MLPVVSSNPKGTNFVRLAIALAAANANYAKATDEACRRWGRTSLPARLLEKAAVAGGMTTSSWADELTGDAAQTNTEFWGVVNARTIVGRLLGMGLRRVPPYTRTIAMTSGLTASWTGEGGAKDVGSAVFAKVTGLAVLKLSVMAVFSDELISSSDPSAERVIRAELIRAHAVALDQAFIHPGNAGVANVQPASVTNGATEATTGSPQGPWDADLEAMLDNFTGDLEGAVLVMRPDLAARLSSADRPAIGARGGEVAGIPVLTSSVVPNGVVVLIDPSGLAVAMPDDQAEIRVNTQGSVEMSDAPAGSSATPTAASVVSLWQTNSVGILAERIANWRRVRTGSVVFLTGASY